MENEVTKSPFDWEVKARQIEAIESVEAIEGGIDDERFKTTTMDKLKDAAIIAAYTPQFIGLTMDFITKNWKTFVSGAIALAVQILPQLGIIDQQTATAISVIAASLGLLVAKDHNVTGGTKPQ